VLVCRARFGGIVLLYFYSLVFVGELIFLNMTTSVVIVCFSSRKQASGEKAKKEENAQRLDPLMTRKHELDNLRTQTRQILLANTGDIDWRYVLYDCFLWKTVFETYLEPNRASVSNRKISLDVPCATDLNPIL
jgi:hypothetical protein